MKIKKGFNLRTVMGQNIVLAEGDNADSFGKMIKLNKSAALLWEKLKGKTFDADYAAGVLMDAFEGLDREQAMADAAEFIDSMAKSGLIE